MSAKLFCFLKLLWLDCFQTAPMHLWSDENLENAKQEDKLMKKDVWIPDRYWIVAYYLYRIVAKYLYWIVAYYLYWIVALIICIEL
jgi:hypothetical protein